jgi:hypothetical protein
MTRVFGAPDEDAALEEELEDDVDRIDELELEIEDEDAADEELVDDEICDEGDDDEELVEELVVDGSDGFVVTDVCVRYNPATPTTRIMTITATTMTILLTARTAFINGLAS